MVDSTERILELGSRCCLEDWLAGWFGLQIIEKTWASCEPNGNLCSFHQEITSREKGRRERRESDRDKNRDRNMQNKLKRKGSKM